jgi:NAD(P)-dependent dehydrogenase (short-subunit alcohol dehydrogenase family)
MNKNIFITGHTSGLGLGLKEYFSQEEYNVYGLSRSCQEDENNIKINLSNLSLLREKIDKFMSNKKFSFCFLNAGILGGIKKVIDIDQDEMLNSFSINVVSTKLIIDSIIRNGCCENFIVISSGAANKGYDGWLNYCISKSSLKQMVSCYAIENEHLHFISLAPGVIKTKMQDEIIGEDVEKFSSIQKFKDLYHHNPTPLEISKKIYENLDLIRSLENGSFFDLRSIK